MPLFDFRCKKCSKLFEELASREQTPACPKCGGESERQLPCRIHTRYHGSGFYSTDYKKSS